MIEFEQKKEAEAAIAGMNGQAILGEPVQVDWAFVNPKGSGTSRRARMLGL